jgi:hypothetical protein
MSWVPFHECDHVKGDHLTMAISYGGPAARARLVVREDRFCSRDYLAAGIYGASQTTYGTRVLQNFSDL